MPWRRRPAEVQGPFRSRSVRGLGLELTAIVILLTAVGFAIWWFTRPAAVITERPLGGRDVNLSRNDRDQYQPDVAVDPSNPRILLAGSTDALYDTRVYNSSDGGATWRTRPGPPLLRSSCGYSSPRVAIDRRSRQWYAFVASEDCHPRAPHMYVGVRRGTTGRWRVVPVERPGAPHAFDDKTALALDPGSGRAYVAWTRLPDSLAEKQTVLLSHSDDGVQWSTPVELKTYPGTYSLSLGVGPRGDVYLGIADGARGVIDLLRSADGGRSFGRPRRVARLHEIYFAGCGRGSAQIRAQPQRCVGPDPTVVTAPSGEVVLVYAVTEENGTQGVSSASFNRELRPLRAPSRVGPPDAKPSDQFLPSAALDGHTGDLWACYLDTFGDPGAKRAWLTCTVSRDLGRRWAAPVRAAAAPSDQTLFGAGRYGYGDQLGLAAAAGIAHPVWTDDRDLLTSGEDIHSATIQARRLR